MQIPQAQVNAAERTPVKERWLVRMFSPPSVDKVDNYAYFHRSYADGQTESAYRYRKVSERAVSRLRQPTKFSSDEHYKESLHQGTVSQEQGQGQGQRQGQDQTPQSSEAMYETPNFMSHLREPSPNKFKESTQNKAEGDAEMRASYSPQMQKVKRKLVYNSPIKSRLLASKAVAHYSPAVGLGEQFGAKNRVVLRPIINQNQEKSLTMDVDDDQTETETETETQGTQGGQLQFMPISSNRDNDDDLKMIGQKRQHAAYSLNVSSVAVSEAATEDNADPFRSMQRPLKRQKIADQEGDTHQRVENKSVQSFSAKREGNLEMGDTPLYLRNCVVIEGDIFWKVVWQSNSQASLFDSFEMESDLCKWSYVKFSQLKEQALQLQQRSKLSFA